MADHRDRESYERSIAAIDRMIAKLLRMLDWTDDEIVSFAEQEYPCGTTCGWVIRREGDKLLAGCPERNSCKTRKGFVHVVLDA